MQNHVQRDCPSTPSVKPDTEMIWMLVWFITFSARDSTVLAWIIATCSSFLKFCGGGWRGGEKENKWKHFLTFTLSEDTA